MVSRVLRKSYLARSENHPDVEKLFADIDREGTKTIGVIDLAKFVGRYGVHTTPMEMQALFDKIDVKKQGCINLDDFRKYVAEIVKDFDKPLTDSFIDHCTDVRRDISRSHTARFQGEEQSLAFKLFKILVGVGMGSSTLSFVIDQFTYFVGLARARLTVSGSDAALGMVIVFNIGLAVIGRLVVRTTIEAEGSGFPELKAMLFGKVMFSFLTMRVLVVKAIALAFVVGAGLPIGKEGPNVQMAACIAATLGASFFTSDKQTPREKIFSHRLLIAACCVGVGSTFSAPIGGVIFALEFMLPQIYDFMTYWGGFVAAIVGSLSYAIWRAFTSGSSLTPLISTNVLALEGSPAVSNHPFAPIILDVMLGALCGFLAGVWIIMHTKINKALKMWRLHGSCAGPPAAPKGEALLPKSNLRKSIGQISHSFSRHFRSSVSDAASCQWRDIFIIVIVVTVNTILASKLPLLGGKPQPLLMSTLFDKLLTIKEATWTVGVAGPVGTLILCLLMKWFTTIFALSLPTPTGVVAPSMIIGALIGRVFIHSLPIAFRDACIASPDGRPLTDMDRGAFEARFAIVGASAFASGVTRTFAMAITIFEVLSLPAIELPLVFSTLTSIFIANQVSLPFFDCNLVGRGLAGIARITSTKRRLEPVSSIMKRIQLIDCLPVRCSIREMRTILATSTLSEFAIVHDMDGYEVLLTGTIRRSNAETLLGEMDPDELSPEKVINFSDRSLHKPRANAEALVEGCPLQISADTTLRDAYITLQATHKDSLYVTSDGCLVGTILFHELLELPI